jgi:hypothetical protein
LFQYPICSNDSGPCWDILGNDRICSNNRIVTNCDGAEDLGSSSNVDTIANFWRGHHTATVSNGYLMADDHILAQFRPTGEDNAKRMGKKCSFWEWATNITIEVSSEQSPKDWYPFACDPNQCTS